MRHLYNSNCEAAFNGRSMQYDNNVNQFYASADNIRISQKDNSNNINIKPTGITLKTATENDCFTCNGGTYDLAQKLDISAAITDAEITELFS